MNIEELHKRFIECDQKISTDSRDIEPGSMFFAWHGAEYDGNIFVKEALEAGASYAVVDNTDYIENEKYILVDNSMDTLQELAAYHRKQFEIPVIAITGSNGKTTTKELVNSILKIKKNVLSTEGNLNNHTGVPKTLLKIRPETEIAIIEMGANHIGEIAHLCDLAAPTHGIITNIGRAHLGFFGGFDNVIRAKTELYRYIEKTSGECFINGEDSLLLGESNADTKITYLSADSDYPLVSLETNPLVSGVWRDQKIESSLTGEYNISNISAAIAISSYFGLDDADITNGIKNFIPKNERSEIIETENGNLVIKDYYNANLSSMESAIDNLLKIRTDRSKIAILGDMFELGKYSAEEHEAVLNGIGEQDGIDTIILIGQDFSNVYHEYKNITQYKDIDEALLDLKKMTFKDSVILLKASQGMNFRKLFNSIDW